MSEPGYRKGLLISLGVMLLLFLPLAALNAFRLSFLNPSTTGEIFLFTFVVAVGFVLFLSALLLIVRNALKQYANQRSRVLGERLRTRMLWGAVLISLLPITCMFGFSYLLLNRAVDRWFSQPAGELRDDSARIGVELTRYISANAHAEAASVASGLTARGATASPQHELEMHETTLQGGFLLIYRNEQVVYRFRVPDSRLVQLTARSWEPQAAEPAAPVRVEPHASGTLDTLALRAARDLDEPILSVNGGEYVVGSAFLRQNEIVVVALPLPQGLSANLARLRQDGSQYWKLFSLRRQIRATYMIFMLIITAVALLCALWLALHLSRLVTRPVEALADAMNAVAQGNYTLRIDRAATEELGELTQVFNSMATELERGRQLVEQSTVQVLHANTALDMRRQELETMLQTVPSGVIMLNSEQVIRVANRAFSEMLDPGGQRSYLGSLLERVLPAEALEPIEHLIQRSHRMSSASGELEMQSSSGMLHLVATVSLLESGNGGGRTPAGYVVVLENVSELLRAQKQSAWKEVARRVAHEIKNPLTPISLSAEQIRRHAQRLADLMAQHGIEAPSVATIHRSSEVISSSVESMRSLVDQFSSLAEFPTARPRPADLNTVVDNTLALFAGRTQKMQIKRNFAPRLPLVLLDPEALERALSNLIDNAAEAMSSSLLRELEIGTRLSENTEGMVELVVADTGPGVTDAMRENLFLPYFSTKQRGSGLGLTIAAKIVAEHQGTIRVEKNVPSGARFVLELPIAHAAQPDAEQVALTEVLQ